MSRRTVVITGASDGIGAAAARALAKAGEEVVVVGRSPEKTEAVARSIGAASFVADYTRLDTVRELAAALRQAYPRIDVLANNAGGVMGTREVTADGFEKTFQVNHLGGFLLTALLMPTLLSSGATVVNTSSVAAQGFGRFDIGDLNNEKSYVSMRAYGNGKLANILHVRELQQRFSGQGLAAAAFHPGVIASNFGSESGLGMKLIYHTPLRYFLKGVEAGADPLVWLATSRPGVDWSPGEYYEKRRVARSSDTAYDAVLAGELWERSAEMVGVPVDLGLPA